MKRKLQVFVSSTFTDLVEERQAAVAAILKAGHIPAGMELFTAGDVSQMEVIKRWIDESDVYMLILGGRYGSVELTTSLSYTELEYDYAKEQGKALFAVVIQEEALEARIKSGGSIYFEKENPKALAEFRKKVLTNISSFFSDTKDIKLCVHESLADFSAKPGLKGWVSAAEVPDAKSLNNEIDTLRRENAALTDELKKITSQRNAEQTRGKVSTEEMLQVLKAIEVTVPADLTSDHKAYHDNIYNLAKRNLDMLILGINNRTGAPPVSSFLYWNVFPKLQAHGLADNEHVPGSPYRRSYLNTTGKRFFAEIQRREVLAKSTVSKPKKINSTS